MKHDLSDTLEQHRRWLESGRKEGQQARLDYRDLSQVDLSGADLRKASLRGTRLIRAHLAGCRFDDADLRNADLSYADLQGVVFDDARMADAVLDGARLDDASLRRAQLQRASMLHLVGPRANWSQADLRGADFSQARSSGARFDAASLMHCVFDSAQLDGASMRYCQINRLSMKNANARGVDLSFSQLAYSQFPGTDMAGACLDGARVQGCVFLDANFGSGSMAGTRFVDGSLVGATLAGIDLDTAFFDGTRGDAGVLPQGGLDSDVPLRRAVGSGRALLARVQRLQQLSFVLAILCFLLGTMGAVWDGVLLWRHPGSSGFGVHYGVLFGVAGLLGAVYFLLMRTGFSTTVQLIDLHDRIPRAPTPSDLDAAAPASPAQAESTSTLS